MSDQTASVSLHGPQESKHSVQDKPERGAEKTELLLLPSPPSRSGVSESVRPQRRQPTRLRRPWESPGNNTGVGCHFFLQCMKVKSESEVASVMSDSV